MIIFINHMPSNPWYQLTPSRLGPSDAAELFVFLSGFASSIAYGRTFNQAGLALGSLQVALRCSQLYLAHLTLFLMMAGLLLIATSIDSEIADWQLDNLGYFFEQTRDALPGLLGLTYVPNFVDILPMYLVILLYLPLFWGLSRISPLIAGMFSISLYSSAWYFGWELTADPISGRSWYFNPFCWQLIFFTGYGFGAGWLSPPRASQALIWPCLGFIVFCFPLENQFIYQRVSWFADFRQNWPALLDKSHLGLLRYGHFLAMAYLIAVWMRPRQHLLNNQLAASIIAMGRQSLPIFMLGTCLSFVGGILLNNQPSDLLNSLWINIAGLGLLILCAHCLNWLAGKPWKYQTNHASLGQPSQFWPLFKQAVPALALAGFTSLPLLFPSPTAMQTSENATLAADQKASDRVIVLPETAVPETDEASYQTSENLTESPDNI